jgi:predicted ABC-type ATPase
MKSNITLLFFWLNDLKLAIERVKTRVAEGGHNIPEETIIRRYNKGVENLLTIFVDLCDYWLVIDNSNTPYTFIAKGNEGKLITVFNNEKWEQIKNSK